ncbi:DUF5988 family protein [Streptomyces sp. NPDC007083]|uniref:DUF5988 family protein n=1 Tax=unclassified Streptomyces TaxID=2593676 RepID=UPI0034036C5F
MRDYIQVVLKGGPEAVPRIITVPREDHIPQVKVLHGNGYEHFEATQECEEHQGGFLPVYRWCYRTFIAE